VWSSFLGGAGTEIGNAVAFDAAGNVYVTGRTSSGNFPIVGGFDSNVAGNDAFVVRVAAAGSSLDWSSFLGGASSDYGTGIAVDGAGDVVVVGQTTSSDFPSMGGFDSTLSGTLDAFVTMVGGGGALLWSTYLGGTSEDWANEVALDGSGRPWVIGATQSSDFPVVAGFDSALGGPADAFVARIDPAGPTLDGSSYLGGSDEDYGTSVAVGPSGDPLLAGNTLSLDFPAPGGFDATANGMFDAFVVRIDGVGLTLVWGTYLGGSDVDYGLSVAEVGGDAIVAGSTFSADFPAIGGIDTTLGGAQDGTVARIDGSGAPLVSGSFLGGGGDELSWAADATGAGNFAVAGQTSSNDFPALGGFDTTYAGAVDAFVAVLLDCGDGACAPPETECNCPADCTGAPGSCGDDCCNGGEDSCTCPVDCGADMCGNGCCAAGETACSCPADCGADACGNGCCGSTEGPCVCPADCTADTCGDACCGPSENACTCNDDCGDDSCGNGCCGATENHCTCPADCATPYCGDCCCDPGETAASCAPDCANNCGNGVCGSCEDATNCPEDCACDGGPCESPGPEPAADAEAADGPPRPASRSSADDGCGCAIGAVPAASWLPLAGVAWLAARLRPRRRRLRP
jgi:hypothetical protein